MYHSLQPFKQWLLKLTEATNSLDHHICIVYHPVLNVLSIHLMTSYLTLYTHGTGCV